MHKLAAFDQGFDEELGPKRIGINRLRDFVLQLQDLGLKPASQARLISAIKGFFNYLVLEQEIETNPAELLEAPRIGRKLPDTLSFEEIQEILSKIDVSTMEGTRNRAIIEVLYACGLRVSELTGLRLQDIQRKEEIIRVIGKGNKERWVPIGKPALKMVDIYLGGYRNKQQVRKEAEEIVFLNNRGGALSRVMIFKLIRKYGEQAGIRKTISPHTFRHSFATHLVEGGADLRIVQELLGHESITTTEIYTHLNMEYLREAIYSYHPLFGTGK
jgi:integrase/recombinase XerD